MKQDIAEIAGKLTERQRDALLTGWESIGVARVMKRKGLSSGYLGNDPRLVAIVETTLGDAVRAHLLAHSYTEKMA